MSLVLRLSVLSMLLVPPIPPAGSGYGAEILHHDLEARIDPLQRSIAVTDVLTVALERPPQREPFGFFLNRHLRLSEVSAVDGGLSFTIQEMPSRETLRAYFPAYIPATKRYLEWQGSDGLPHAAAPGGRGGVRIKAMPQHQVTLHRLSSSFAEPEVVQCRADRVGMPSDLDAEGGLGAGAEQPSDVPHVTCALLPGR